MQTAQALETQCHHCGLRFFPRTSELFCCRGCEAVFNLLQSKGLERFYELQNSRDLTCPIPAKVSTETYAYCDDPYFISEMSHQPNRMTFYLEGLNCTACLWLLEKTPELCDDCESIQVRMSDSIVEVVRKNDHSFSKIAQVFDRFGYTPHVVKQGSDKAVELKNQENRRDLIRIGVAGGCTGNIMILAVSLYAGASGAMAEQFRWVSALLAAPVLTYCAWPFYKSTLASLKNRHLNIDVPIVAALIAGIVISIWGLFSGTESLFFDSLSMLVFLLLSSRFLLKKIQQSHLDTSNLTSHLLLARAERKCPQGTFETVSSLALQKGDVIRISDNSVVCADGEIIEGNAIVNTATLTGESTPHTLQHGDYVYAGTQSLSGSLSGSWLLKVDKPAIQSRLANILEDVRQSTKHKPKTVRLADQAAQWFVIAVFSLALSVFFYFFSTQPLEGASRALALIIVTCPCVFGMAIPLSMSLAIKKAAEAGIIIKGGDTLEKLTRVKTVFFDKTGTLTKGNLEVSRIIISEKNLPHLDAAVALEKNQHHPIARALLKAIDSNSNLMAQNVRLLTEGGIAGEVNGKTYSIIPSDLLESPKGAIKTRYSFLCEDIEVAQFEFGDEIRSESQALIQWLKKHSLSARILSGDREKFVLSCAADLDIDSTQVTSQATPEMKSQILKEAGTLTAMVGDGANDVAALASASVGIAVSGSLDVSLRAADVYLTRNSLSDLKTLFTIARRTQSAMKRNLLFSLCFNIVAGTLAIAGLMTPLWAAVIMPLSSLVVLLSSLHAGQKLTRESHSWR